MLEPDFGEHQLQYFIVSELANLLHIPHKQPIVPTPHEEKTLGWDAGFNIPFLKLPNTNQKNCNLFLQFKLLRQNTCRSCQAKSKDFHLTSLFMWA